jgi:hypothetical protein
MVMIMQIESAGQSKMMKQYVSLIEFKTVLDNGREILTNNSPVSHPLSKQPHIQLFRRSEIQDERELLFHHIKDVEVVRDRFGGSPVEQSPETFQTDFPAQWEREMAYQIKTGRLSTSDKTGELKGTLPLVLHAVTPSGNSFAWFLTVPAACALIVGILAIPGITIALTSGESPHVQALLEALLEALLITGICGAAGYSAGSGGFAMGLLTWFPSMLLLVSGPVGWIIPPVLAFNAGQLGEKLSKLPGPVGVPFHRLVRPEIWLIPFLIAAGCVI